MKLKYVYLMAIPLVLASCTTTPKKKKTSIVPTSESSEISQTSHVSSQSSAEQSSATSSVLSSHGSATSTYTSASSATKPGTSSTSKPGTSATSSTKPGTSSTSKPGTSSTSTPKPSSSSSVIGPVEKDAYTVMIYMCGSDLESGDSLMTKSITNMLSASGQPDDYNIIIETGGASRWNSKYGIKSNALQRYHIANQKLILDATLSATNNMGLSSTFQSFMEWGLTSYPAEKTAVIFSNHGGAMWGCCFDENNPLSGLSYEWDDGLLNNEINTALKNAFKTCNQTTKLEWIGYDACLMQMQDIAEFNSQYFNYMIASQENEGGEGWDYANWFDDLFKGKTTEEILTEVCNTYISSEYAEGYDNITLSWLDLNQMSTYYSAFEALASELKNKITSGNKSSFLSLVKSCKSYGEDYSYYYGSYDVKNFLDKLVANSTFNPGGDYITNVLSGFNSLVRYSKATSKAANSNGLCLFFSTNSDTEQSTYYSSSQTNFTNWRYLSNTYGK